MAVAYVAYQQLTPEKKLRVAALLKKNPYYNTKWKALIPSGTPADQRDLMLFMIAATWPDEIKEKGSTYLNDGDQRLPPMEPHGQIPDTTTQAAQVLALYRYSIYAGQY